ncbi:VOC family protein [Arvimicrobium flavum]|uniref:VOC family protein n=1 Tax=Arvimicrobium flavum TaxID=3393320 RepID=UPI00237B5C84|nr:VOC family protein [Mesorhizobium shangrilense]
MTQSAAPQRAAVWFEIPVSDLKRGMAFYGSVLQAELSLDETGANPTAVFPSLDPMQAGHLYPGKPATGGIGPTVHLAVSDPIEAALERVTEAGGKVVSPVITIPPGRFAYCVDPDGNSFGVFV